MKKESADLGFPIIGIGASAGGLAAFESFFSGIPKNTTPNMAFVLIQHLSPTHKSLLSEIIRHYTKMQVFEVTQGMVVESNCIYVIPPNCNMALSKGILQLSKLPAIRANHLAIDFFFNSLAEDQKERSIAIVLSGTGSDGSVGIEAIKNAGGMVMVQNPENAEFSGMPSSAVATKLADYVLSPQEMPSKLLAYVSSMLNKRIKIPTTIIKKDKDTLKNIFTLLHKHTGHDFSEYKPSTIHRRIERQMAVVQVANLEEYTQYLKHTPAEILSLFHSLLIGVTSFFVTLTLFHILKKKLFLSFF